MRWTFALLLLSLIGLAGCITLSLEKEPAGELPSWVSSPKSADSIYAYSVGTSTAQPSQELAREKAFRSALINVFKDITAGVSLTADESVFLSSAEVKGAEIVPDCIQYESTKKGYDCWVQVSYPLSERARILKQYELGKPLRDVWEAAKASFVRGDFESARSNAVRIITGKNADVLIPFDIDDVKLLLAETCREQKDFLEARRWYENLSTLSKKDSVRQKAAAAIVAIPRAPRFWPMNDRFGGKKVALVCGVREGKVCEKFADLSGMFSKECREARLTSVDISDAVKTEGMAGLFDKRDFSAAVTAAAAQKAGVIIAVLMDVDPEKRAVIRQKGATDAAAIDTSFKFLVIRVADGVCLYDCVVKESSGATANTGVATHAVAIFIQNYLVPKCPALDADTK